ncbi:DMT family transporter [Erythrobacter sp. EC-HK427]|uniref:DMT family transporter n=1 Tax=Erythrobacter sp. EC-HK427 TaxID=2038396 RepID=UPI0012598015|nr:DMT family transporter [Erythrobacter sp. EC-HK427]VVT12901.1 putative amino-acid metabolite efflux pump [Erythrobacter sp. EC-HK427]
MPFRDIALLVLLCVIWAANVIVSRIVVTDLAVPPLFFAALRSLVVVAALIPWLQWPGKDWWRVALVTTSVSGLGFALMFVGLQDATPSSAAIVQLSGAPMTVLLAIVILGEKVRWRRGIGIALALAGVLLAVASPAGWANSTGLLFIFAGAFVGALGSVYLKQIDLSPLRLMAWAGFFSTLLLFPLSLLLEQGQVGAVTAAPLPFGASLAFSGLVVSVFAHTAYFHVLQRNEAGVVAPITLLTPIFTILMGASITGDEVSGLMLVGGALAVAGVLVITIRPSATFFKGLLVRPRL